MENIETLLAAVAQTQGFDDDEPLDSAKSPPPETRTRSELNGAPNEVLKDAVAAYKPPAAEIPAIGAVEKRKRGRPPRAKMTVKAPPPKKMKQEDEEEDVCFICFDGGSLVLCDRKGCPKAYHPSCIKRDEAFFRSKAKWNCGWHICMGCQKTSHYMCYTCTYSLCKVCIKDADYLCVRGNKGFCPTCLKTIMLIENKDHPNNDSVQVDFDDKTSWEYLFKVYWVYLKEKLSLTPSELNQTKRPAKGVAAVTCNLQSSNAQQNAINGKVSVSNRSSEHLELNKPQKETDFPQDIGSKGASGIDNHVVTPNSTMKEDAPSSNDDAERPSTERFTAKPSIVNGTDDPSTEKAPEKLGVEKDADNLRIVDDADKPCTCRTRDKPRTEDPDKPENGNVAEQASSSGKEEASPQARNSIIEKTGASGSLSLPKPINQINVANSAIGGGNDQAMQRSELETSIATASMGNSPTANNIETQKLWHYRDLNGTILGPFSLLLLQQWSTTGLLPTDMRIWKNHEQLDSVILADALSQQFDGAEVLPCNASSDSLEHGATGEIRASEGISGTDNYSKQTEPACSKRTSDLSDSNTRFVRTDNSSSSTWPQCWDLLKDSNSGGDDVRVHNELPSSSLGHTPVAPCDRVQENGDLNHGSQVRENNSSGLTQNQTSNVDDLQNQANNPSQALPSSNRKLRSLCIDLSSHDLTPESGFAVARSSADAVQQDNNGDMLDMHNPTAKTGKEHWRVQTDEEQQIESLDVPMQKSSFLELLSLTPRSSNGDQAAEKKQSNLLDLPGLNSVPNWSTASSLPVGALLPEVPDEWCGKPPVQEWDCGPVSAPAPRPPELAGEGLAISNLNNNQLGHASPSHPEANIPNWLALINEPIEFDALGEESVSDLLAEVDAMESQGGMPSPTSAVKFAKEFIQYCKDDCFGSIEEFGPGKSDALSSTAEVQLTPLPTLPCKPNEAAPVDTLDFFKISGMHSSTSSEGESSAPVFSGEAGAEFHPPASNNTNRETVGANMAPGIGSEPVQGNINLVTVQGNVNLVLGGPAQGMANLGWGTNAGAAWGNPNINHSPINGNVARDGQRKYGGERFASPRERSYQGNETGFISPRERSYQGNETGFISSRERSYQGNETGFIRARPPWGREPYGGGRYSRPPPKGQRVCKFYESGRCKKGAFCDYLHP